MSNVAEKAESFGKILDNIEEQANALSDIDGDFANVFALAEVKGEIERKKLKVKIDASFHKILGWEIEAAGWAGKANYLAGLAKGFADQAKAEQNRAENHRKYMAYKMQARGYEKLQGNHFAVTLERIPNPKTIIAKSREVAKAADKKAFPELVAVEERSYSWDLNAIKAKLKEIEKKKPEDVTAEDKALQEFASNKYSFKVGFAPADQEKA